MTHIWIPKLALMENKDPVFYPGSKASGMFMIEGVLPDGRRRVIAEWQPNLITELGLEHLPYGDTLVFCAVGAGNVPPTIYDTSLASYLATHSSITADTYGNTTSAPYYGWHRKTFRFNAPGTNRTLSEVGVGWSSGGSNLWSRALIKNLAGEPITTPWLAAETLDVSYEMRWYLSTEDVPYEMVISGQTHTGIVRASNITYSAGIYQNFVNAFSTTPGGQGGNSGEIGLYTGTIGAVTGTPSGASGWARGITEHPYVANSRKRTGSHVVGPTTANMGAVTAIFKGNIVQSYQMSVSPALQKNADWTFTFNCETPTWGRYTPP